MVKMGEIRKARLDDLDAITEIYNESVLNSTATFDTQEKTIQEQVIWYKEHDSRFPIWVFEDHNKVMLFLLRTSPRAGHN